jgi:hypothetical protein
MDWLNGLLGGTSNMIPPGQPIPTGAPYGGSPPYAAPGYAPPPQGGPVAGSPPAYGSFGPPQGTAPGAGPEQPAWGAAPPGGGIMASMPNAPGVAPWNAPTAAPAVADPRVAALETRCEELRRDVDSIALFARTLLTMLQEKQLVTPEQFAETHRKLDLLDGKLDDRIGAPR